MKNRVVLSGIIVVLLGLGFSLRTRNSKEVKAQRISQFTQLNPTSADAPEPGDSSGSGVTEPSANAASIPAAPASDFRDWLAQWKANGGNPADLAHGKKLASVRKERILQLFRENPAQAFADSISWSEWKALPEELKDSVEQPFSAVVNFSLLPNCPPPAGESHSARIHPHRVQLNGEWHEAYVFGRKATMTSKEGLPARGILLDGQIVLADQAVEVLSLEDAAAVAGLFPWKGAAGSAASGADANARLALVGGELLQVASGNEHTSLEQLFAKAEKSLNPKAFQVAMTIAEGGAGTILRALSTGDDSLMQAASTWTETPKTTLAVRIRFSDVTTYSYTLTELTNLMNNASNHVKVMSYGKTWLVPRIATISLPKARSQYEATGGRDLMVSDTSAALSAQGITAASYNFIVHCHPGMNVGYAGLGQIGGGISWLNGNQGIEVTVHELGHNYGLGHAHYWAGVTGTGNLGRTQPGGTSSIENEEYGDPFDIMGGSTLPAGQYNARGKTTLNWIEQKEIINVVTNGIYRVHRYDHQQARTNTGTKLALRIPAAGGTYWVSHRKLFTSNTSLVRGAQIAREDSGIDQSLIDTTPLSRPSTSFSTDRTDAGLTVGKTFIDPLETVRITTIASGGVAPLEFIDVQVAFVEDGAFAMYTGPDFRTNGLVGSYVNRSLRTRATQGDWRTAGDVVIAGKRVDERLSFTSDGWGARAPLRITGGTDANWDNFSVQWDGVIVVRRPIRLATTSDDSSRFWIDLDGNGSFASSGPEFVNNHWGVGQGPTRGDLSPLVQPGTYAIRIQYEEGNGGNYFTLSGADAPFEVFTDSELTAPGLTGSYVATSLRTSTAQADWRATQNIAGTREDAYPGFSANGWGSLDEVGLIPGSNGADSDWNNFSVQWDGYLKVSTPVRMATISDDHSRMWIDVNSNGVFATTSPEYINNGWGGGGQGMTLGQLSPVLSPGKYAIRIQYEEGGGGNGFLLAGVPQAPPDAATLLTATTFTGTDTRTTPRRIAGDFTIQFWVRSSQVAGSDAALRDGIGLVDASSTTPGFGVTLGNGRVLFGVNDANSTTLLRSDAITNDQWHHVSARRGWESGELTLFVDGLPVDSGIGSTNLLDQLADITIGALAGGSNNFIGTMDQLKIWDTARTDEQIASDYHSTRNTHGYLDEAPLVRLTRGADSVQVFWDPLSGWRRLEGATSADGIFVPLATDQNSTNIGMGANPMRFFRVRK
ncbi:MAG TPA: LamG-like jellyroll fold domain-containing protein [Verrucomicrobiae bacterium]